MEQVILDENGYATTDGQITVYNYDGETREYMTSSVEYLVAGFGILRIPALMHRVSTRTVCNLPQCRFNRVGICCRPSR